MINNIKMCVHMHDKCSYHACCSVTVLFSNIVQYTDLSSRVSPLEVVTFLNELFSMFDELSRRHGVCKVDTIGGGPRGLQGHAVRGA